MKIDIPERSVKVSALWAAPSNQKAVLVLAHGAGAGMNHAFMESLSNGLNAHGIATLRYNFPYMEAGRKAPDRLQVLSDTIRSALLKAIPLADGHPIFLGGKSMGGRMSSSLASQEDLPSVRGIVFFGFPLHAPGEHSSNRGTHLFDVKQPMLFIQGTRDKLADLSLLEPIVKKIGRRASLHIVEGGDHSFHVLKSSGRTNAEVLQEVVDVSAAWMVSKK